MREGESVIDLTAGNEPVAAVIADAAGAFPADGEPGRALRRLAADLAAPLEVAVSGRPGVGRTTVAAALAGVLGATADVDDATADVDGATAGGVEATAGGVGEPISFRVVDLPPIDALDRPDPDLDRDILVHVVGDRLCEVDRRVIADRDPGATVVVIGPAATGPGAARVRRECAPLRPPVVAADEVADLTEAVRACAPIALRARHRRAADAIEEAAITHRFARDRLEALLQRVAVADAATVR